MNTWNQFYEWLTASIVAAAVWVSGALAPNMVPPTQTALPGASAQSLTLAWAQQTDQPPIEQVGEETGDVEALDEGGSPPADVQPIDQELQDAGTTPTAPQDDVELLDQGAPPVAVETTAPPAETVYVAPVADAPTTSVVAEPAVAAGPVLPEGFGTGRVHASAGRTGFPPGLEDCHVGAVTGRAYVGLDCGEGEETAFVGHAPSFEEFPFVVDAPFPFEGDEAFFSDDFPFGDDAEIAVAESRDNDSGGNVFVSAGRGARDRSEDADTAPVIETSGESSVAFAQRARDREPRVRVEDRGSNRSRNDAADRREGGKQNVASESNDNGVSAEAKGKKGKDKKKTKNKKDRDNAARSESKDQEAKGDKDKKKRGERKDDRKRTRDGN